MNPELEQTTEALGRASEPTGRKPAADAPTLSTRGGTGHPSATDYPPKPRSWRNQLGRGAGECGKCGRWWTGINTARHRNFTTVAAFDKHRAGSHAYDTRHCVDPEKVLNRNGEHVLVDAGRDYPCWGFPAGEWWSEDGGAA